METPPEIDVTTCCEASLADVLRVEFSTTDQADVNDVATVSSATPDPDPSNNEATGHVSFVGAADLVITKTGPPSVLLGSTFSYTLSVDNLGPSRGVVTDVLSPGVSFVSAVASIGTFTAVGGTITWNLGRRGSRLAAPAGFLRDSRPDSRRPRPVRRAGSMHALRLQSHRHASHSTEGPGDGSPYLPVARSVGSGCGDGR